MELARSQSVYALSQSWADGAPVAPSCTAAAGALAALRTPAQAQAQVSDAVPGGAPQASSGDSLATAAQFYKWHAELASAVRRVLRPQRRLRAESARSAERSEKYEHYAVALTQRVAACTAVLAEVRLGVRLTSPGLGTNPMPGAGGRHSQPLRRAANAAPVRGCAAVRWGSAPGRG